MVIILDFYSHSVIYLLGYNLFSIGYLYLLLTFLGTWVMPGIEFDQWWLAQSWLPLWHLYCTLPLSPRRASFSLRSDGECEETQQVPISSQGQTLTLCSCWEVGHFQWNLVTYTSICYLKVTCLICSLVCRLKRW